MGFTDTSSVLRELRARAERARVYCEERGKDLSAEIEPWKQSFIKDGISVEDAIKLQVDAGDFIAAAYLESLKEAEDAA